MSQIRREGMEAVLRDQAESFVALDGDFANRESLLVEAYEDVLARLDRAGS